MILRELRLDKLKIGRGLRAVRYEEKIRIKDNSSPVKKCWERKQRQKRKNYIVEKKVNYYNSFWAKQVIEDIRVKEGVIDRMLIKRERDIQKQIVDGRIRDARYNNKYKEIDLGEQVYRVNEVDRT